MAKFNLRKAIIIASLAAASLLTACGAVAQTSSNEPHTHYLVKYGAKKTTCKKDGRLAYWHCEDCGEYYLDAKATKPTTLAETVVPALPHTPEKTDGVEPTCTKSGKIDYWTCTECLWLFSDEACTVRIDETQLTVSTTPHDLTHVEGIPVDGMNNGLKEHWTCGECFGYFADASGFKKIKEEDTIAYSLFNIPDFLVEVPAGRDPVVLQLTDTQFIDGGQVRPGRTGVDKNFYATNKMNELCFDYLTEVITATNPDLIILTGDIIYGEFDDNGSVWQAMISFMESFNIAWAPIFGNHDNESKMGVDWQCEQLVNAEHCLFEQKELSGNGNYSVGIKQGEKITRVFYMLDSNGCGNASDETLANGHTIREVGFKQDQIEWYTKQITILKEVSPETKISFAYHIQTAIFADAYKKYGFDQEDPIIDINIEAMEDKTEGDFGYIGAGLKGAWDANKSIFKGMKALGVDSIFVGHEHEISASVVYDGIRFQFGQKSSQYDRYNYLMPNGDISNVFGANPEGTTPLMGGTVIVLSETDGAIKDSYIYYCGFENGQIDWTQYNN